MPRLLEPLALPFGYVMNYDDVPVVPVMFSQQNQPGIPVMCLIDSGASAVMLPSELASPLGITLEAPTRTVIGVTGSAQGWVHQLNATFPDLDDLTLDLEVVFLPQLPIALIGREPFFQRVDVAFRHAQGNVYFQPV